MELRSRKLITDGPSPSGTPRASAPTSRPTSSRSPADTPRQPNKFPLMRVVAAWLVHLYTGTGLLVNMYSLLFALLETPDFSLFAKLNWLAILIDATDGTLARFVDVKKVVPTYDGALLDNIIDYQTFAVLPALAVVVFDIVPGEMLQFAVASAVLLSAGYQFCQTTAKTTEAFVGFPSYWNIVVFYIYYLRCSTPVTLAVFGICAVLSFVPIHFIYPTRTLANYYTNIIGAWIWATLMLVPTFFPQSKYAMPALYASFAYVVYYIAISVVLDQQRRKEEREEREE